MEITAEQHYNKLKGNKPWDSREYDKYEMIEFAESYYQSKQVSHIKQKIKALEAEKKQASKNDDQHEWECVVEELEQRHKALELVENNCFITK